MLQRMTTEIYLNFPFPKEIIYTESNRFMDSWWGTDSYFKNEQI